jgi:hypothetical protein
VEVRAQRRDRRLRRGGGLRRKVREVWRRWLVGADHDRRLDAEHEKGHGEEGKELMGHTADHVGEASWASLCRAIALPCGLSARLEYVDYDADRCPSDLVTVPMQVSMRDVVAMALMSGMEVISASFSRRVVAMHGSVGSLTNAQHPVLGPLLHFLPRSSKEMETRTAFGYAVGQHRGFIDVYWLARAMGASDVAWDRIQWRRRLAIQKIDKLLIGGKAGLTHDPTTAHRSRQNEAAATRAERQGIPAGKEKGQQDGTTAAGKHSSRTDAQTQSQYSRAGDHSWRFAPVLSQDGSWSISLPTHDAQEGRAPSPSVGKGASSDETDLPGQNIWSGKAGNAAEEFGSESNVREPIGRQAFQRVDMSSHKPRQPSRSTDREELPASFPEAGPPIAPQRQLLEYPIEAQQNASRTKATEQEARSTHSSFTSEEDDEPSHISPYWYSQINIRHGYWATPWHNGDLTPESPSLRGCIMVVLEAFLVGKLVTREQIIFTDDSPTSRQSFRDTAKWMCSAMQTSSKADGHAACPQSESSYHRTYPAYARNARGGVIAQGTYKGAVSAIFGPPIVVPVLELARSYEWQVRRGLDVS